MFFFIVENQEPVLSKNHAYLLIDLDIYPMMYLSGFLFSDVGYDNIDVNEGLSLEIFFFKRRIEYWRPRTGVSPNDYCSRGMTSGQHKCLLTYICSTIGI